MSETTDPTAGERVCPHYGGRLDECSICTGIDS